MVTPLNRHQLHLQSKPTKKKAIRIMPGTQVSKINQDLGKAALQGHIEYWQHSLEGIPAVLELPTDRPRPEQHSFAGEMVVVEWDGELVKGLRDWGGGTGQRCS